MDDKGAVALTAVALGYFLGMWMNSIQGSEYEFLYFCLFLAFGLMTFLMLDVMV